MCGNSLLMFFGMLVMSGVVLTSDVPGGKSCSRFSDKNEPTCDTKLSTPKECARPCVEGEPPKVCYYHFTLEFYTVLGGACSLCTPNETNAITPSCQCVTADGYERGILTVNRMLPGPSIHVCKGDRVVIDVKNAMIGMETTIHWHGIFQHGSQYYDGVPYVTQCPILYGTTFRYQYDADNEGTHFYHAHDGTQKMDGIHGKLIVRIPPSEDPNSDDYDYDLIEHEMLIADWTHDFTTEHYPGLLKRNAGAAPVSLLINGQGRYTDPISGNTTTTPLAKFIVKPNCRYRFRIINSFCSNCPAELVFQGHTLKLIAVDGVPVEPVEINTIISFPGERFDCILTTDQPATDYYIQLRALGSCSGSKIQQLAILQYSGEHSVASSPPPTFNSSLPKGVTLNPLDGLCNVTRPDALCYNQLTSARRVDKEILTGEADIQFYFTVGISPLPPVRIFRPGSYERFVVLGPNPSAAVIDNITYVSPPSPALSQFEDIPKNSICSEDKLPENCSTPCACTHIIDIKKNQMVEMILIDSLGISGISHPFHMHGYAFNVMAMGKSPNETITRMSTHHARYLNSRGFIRRRFHRPPFKDTVPVPTGGYVVLRFRANNAGYWFFHCHFLFHQLAGMEMIIHVGDDKKDLPPVPDTFPRCGNHEPAIMCPTV